jgi:hypothetical protein
MRLQLLLLALQLLKRNQLLGGHLRRRVRLRLRLLCLRLLCLCLLCLRLRQRLPVREVVGLQRANGAERRGKARRGAAWRSEVMFAG